VSVIKYLRDGSRGARAIWIGRGGQIWGVSRIGLIEARSCGEATIAPRRCPGRQYDLENEKRYSDTDEERSETRRAYEVATL